jgi:DNA-binding NtrC family response regulator
MRKAGPTTTTRTERKTVMAKSRIALIDPDSKLLAMLSSAQDDRFEVVCFPIEAEQQLIEEINEKRCVALIADFRTTDGGGHREDHLLEQVAECQANFPIIMLTSTEDCPEPLARRAAMTEIVHLSGNPDVETLTSAVADLLPAESVDSVATTPKPTITHTESPTSDNRSVLKGLTRQFETEDPLLQRMLSDLEIAAKHDVTILLIGETGSGKTFLSRLIHEVSPRVTEPFLNVACGALPSELIESELFGHMKGSFTSAHADKEGKFVAAGRGTVLLDEIDVLGPEQQVKLLRVIESGEFEPVGSNQTHTSQARLVVASNLDLQPLVEEGKFRPDLYYRLNMLKFEIPPLRQRKIDIIPLAKTFVEQQSAKHGVEVNNIDDRLLDVLLRYPWPGNVRELENVIQRAVIYCDNSVLKTEHLPSHILSGSAGPTNDPSVRLPGQTTDERTLGGRIASTEKDIIEQTLFRNNFSKTNTARELGISRVTLYNKLKKYGMHG